MNLFIFDQSLFQLINHLPHSVLSDKVALFISGVGSWGIIWVIAVLILFIREETKHHSFFLPLLTALGISVISVEYILKPLFGRLRPDYAMGAIVVDMVNNGYSFPSGHASFAFAGAVVLSSHEPRYRWIYYIAAILICLSRIYLGKHYPSDVIAGAVIGFIIGRVVLRIYKPYFDKWRRN